VSGLRRFRGFDGQARRGQRGSGAPPVATYQSILGPLLVEMWHSYLNPVDVGGGVMVGSGIALAGGAFVDTWTGQKLGYVLQAPAAGNRPVYAADGGAFTGRSVVQTASAGSLCLITANLSPPLFATGTRPWLWCVCRLRTISGGANNTYIEIVDNPVTRAQPVLFSLNGNVTAQDGATNATAASYADTGVHAYVTGYSAAGAIQLISDTAVLATAGSGLSIQNASGGAKLSVGGAFNWTSASNLSIATVLALSAAPSAAQQAAMLALDKADWGF
jgi:hypothetical protein